MIQGGVMRSLLLFILLLVVFIVVTKAQTNANIPCPENVLVVYNSNSDTSFMVANYYKNARNIPSSNIIPLTIPIKDTIEINNVIHPISIIQSGEIIQDDYATENDGGEESEYVATFHAW
jgi:hypothetical protein